jgi:hypothetical protein
MAAALARADAFIAAHPEIFELSLIGDKELQGQLATLGAYELDESEGNVHLSWEQPLGFDRSWTSYSLTLIYPHGKGSDRVLQSLWGVVERLRTRIPEFDQDWQAQVIAHFQMYAGQMQDWELEDYELDTEGEVTVASILRHAGRGSIVLQAFDKRGGEIDAQTYFNVEWDEEHGLELPWDVEGGTSANEKAERLSKLLPTGFPAVGGLGWQAGHESQTAPSNAAFDIPGAHELWDAAQQLPNGVGLVLSLQIKSPPVTDVEKAYYHESHYLLSMDVRGDKVTFKDMQTPRQDYLYAGGWPTFLFAPILQWPELTPLWETLEVREFDWGQAIRKRRYQGKLRGDLQVWARSALNLSFQAAEAAARGIRLRKS